MPFRFVPRRDRKLNRLVKSATERELAKGRCLYEPGASASEVFLVREGHVRLWLTSESGERRRTVAIAGPRELFGLEATFPGSAKRRRSGASAGERTRVVGMDGRRAALALRTAEKSLANLLSALDRDLTNARRWAPGRGGARSAQRLADVLVDLAERFGIEDAPGEVRLPLQLTHQELADLAGAHRSTVTTQLNDWIYRRLLRDGSDGLVIRTAELAKSGRAPGTPNAAQGDAPTGRASAR